MGEVYRARDTKLGRDVALKLLPSIFTNDPERLARFRREAQVLAALNHPHIEAIYGIEKSNGTQFLVLELVDGQSLDQLIARGPIPVADALSAASQIAEALEAAHEKGIIHRDLKPANIALTIGGRVKVLDFGLAKPTDTAGASPLDVMNSPTITSPAMMTGVGVILGTAAYMSPEQAKGRAADKKSDIWAFGCVLYEMLTGARVFPAGDVADTLASILTKSPDWTQLPSATPASCRRLLRRCLERDLKNRLGDVADARLEIDDAQGELRAGASPIAAPRPPRHLALAASTLAIGLMLGALGVAGWSAFSRKTENEEAIRFFVQPPNGTTFLLALNGINTMSLSPDGRTVAFGVQQDGKLSLWVHDLHSGAAHAIAGTEGVSGQPFWSPDGRRIGFIADGQLKTVELASGFIRRLCEVTTTGPASVSGGTWNGSGLILFGGGPSGIQRVADSGGVPTAVTHPQLNLDEAIHRFPAFLPDGRHFLFLIQPNNTLAIGALDSPDITRLFETDSFGQFARPGYLIFVRQGSLMAQRFDADRLTTRGPSTVIADGIASSFQGGIAAFSVAGAALVYRVGPSSTRMTQLRWFDRTGAAISTLGPPLDYLGVESAPDDRHISDHVHEAIGGGDIWIRDADRDTNTRLTAGGHNTGPVWSPDGTRIAFGSNRPATGSAPRDPYAGIFNLFEKRADADPTSPPTLLLDSAASHLPNGWKQPTSWSADALVFEALSPKTGFDIWMLPLTGDRTPRPILQTESNEFEGQISPDGRWLAYTSTETRRQEVYVRPLIGKEGKVQISKDGGNYPRWRRDGRELFYLEPDSKRLMAVVVTTTPTFIAAAPSALFVVPLSPAFTTGNLNANATVPYPYVATKDGGRFLFSVDVFRQSPDTPFTVTLNWQTAVR
jgi:dipeptidyl aminopeptidase/acylaminoacyl peptidase